MASSYWKVALALPLVFAFGCSSGPENDPDGGAGTPDAGIEDAGTADAGPADAGPDDGGEVDGGPSGAVTVDWTDDEAHAATGAVGRLGGSLTATGADGARYDLEVPPGALAHDHDLTLTPLLDVAVDGAAETDAAGVRLQPEGLVFAVPATLTVTPAEATGAPMAVTLVDRSRDLFAPLADAAASPAAVSLDHFSAYVLLRPEAHRVRRAITHASAAVSTDPEALWIEALTYLAERADGLQDEEAAAEARNAVTAGGDAVAEAAEARSAVDGPEAPARLGIAAGAADRLGQADAASRLQSASLTLSDLWLNALRSEVESGPAWGLEPVVRRTVVLMDAWAPERADVARTIAESLASALESLADATCNDWRFEEGRGDLERLAAFVADLGLASPTEAQLLASAETCVAPSFTQGFVADLTLTPNVVASANIFVPTQFNERLVDPDPAPATERDDCGFVTSGLELTADAQVFLAELSTEGHTAVATTTASLDAAGTGFEVTFSGTATTTPFDSTLVITQTSALAETNLSALVIHVENPRGLNHQLDFVWNAAIAAVQDAGYGELMASFVVRGCTGPVANIDPALTSTRMTDGGARDLVLSLRRYDLVINLQGRASAGSYQNDNNPALTTSGETTIQADLSLTVGRPAP